MSERVPGVVPALDADGRVPLPGPGRPRAAVRHDDGVTVVEALCPHRGGPLAVGEVLEGVIVCPWHRSVFRLADGACVAGPARRAITTRPATVDGDTLVIAGD